MLICSKSLSITLKFRHIASLHSNAREFLWVLNIEMRLRTHFVQFPWTFVVVMSLLHLRIRNVTCTNIAVGLITRFLLFSVPFDEQNPFRAYPQQLAKDFFSNARNGMGTHLRQTNINIILYIYRFIITQTVLFLNFPEYL